MGIKEITLIPFCLLLLTASAMALSSENGSRNREISQGYLTAGHAPRFEVIPDTRPESRIPASLLEELSRYRLEDILPLQESPAGEQLRSKP